MVLLRAAAIFVSFALTVSAVQRGSRDQEVFLHPAPPHERPGHTPPGSPPSKDSIYQVLSADPQFSKLVNIINISNDTVALLNDTFAGITFFAPTNEALEPPHKGRHHPPHGHHLVENEYDPSLTFSALLPLINDLAVSTANDSDKERRKEWLAKVVKTIASYHVLEEILDASALAQNTTFASNLTVVTERPLRVRVETLLFPHGTYVNLFSKIVRQDIFAGNGVIHAIDHPLLPPPPAFAALYNFPGVFGTLTSALQRSGLTSELDIFREKPGKDKFIGAETVTFFAPTNRAFEKLPVRLRLFLFSHFGANALKKLLEYHIVPGVVAHTDYFYNVTVEAASPIYSTPRPGHRGRFDDQDLHFSLLSESGLGLNPRERRGHDMWDEMWGHEANPGNSSHTPPVFAANMTMPTLLPNQTLNVHVAQFKSPPHWPGEHYSNKMFVNGQSVALSDLPMVNGAVHAISNLLVPKYDKRERKNPKHHHCAPLKCWGANGLSVGMRRKGWKGWVNAAVHAVGRFLRLIPKEKTRESKILGPNAFPARCMEIHDEWEDWEDWFIEWVNEN